MRDLRKTLAENKKEIAVFALIFLLGTLVRVFAFGRIPYGWNQDEASMAYDAYADIAYGIDRNGSHNPIYAIAWGSGQNMGYNYLVRPFIALFGLNLISVRLPMLLLGLLSLIAAYALGRECVDRRFGMLLMLVLAICPWHIMLSRWALESNMAVAMFLFSALCYAKTPKKNAYFIPAVALSALCAYAYFASAFFLILFTPAIILYMLITKQLSIKYLAAGLLTGLILALPLVVFLFVNAFKLEPARFLWFDIPRLTQMRTDMAALFTAQDKLYRLAQNILGLKNLLVKMDDGLISNAIPEIGALYLFWTPFVLPGIIEALNRGKRCAVPLFFMGAALIYALFISININRVNLLMLALVLFAALGMRWLFDRLKGARLIVLTASFLAFAVFCGIYFGAYSDRSQGMFFGGFDDAVRYAAERRGGAIYLSDQVNAPYILALSAMESDPRVYIDTAVKLNPGEAFEYVLSYDRFITGIPDRASEGAAYILGEYEAPPDNIDMAQAEAQTFGHYLVILT